MPNCVQFFRKGEKEAITLNKLDEELCKHCGVPVDPKKYLVGWFDVYGYECAMGKKLDDPHMETYYTILPGDDEYSKKICEIGKKILAYLRENFTTEAWAEIGRR